MRYLTWEANGRAHALRFGDYGLCWRWGRLWLELHKYLADGPKAIFKVGPFR